ncbi:MAG: ABC transporter ATP-binding protein [Armatimonadetes bacterium]|nr:ABC transporter ATP-binding protein [Armatimonadota bacterium]
MTVVELIEATKVYGKDGVQVTALHEATLSLDSGDFVVILGPSGCGKTTLLNLIGALDVPTSGQVLIEGRDLSELSEGDLTRIRRTKIGFVFQSFNLVPTLTAKENVLLAAEMTKSPKSALEVLASVGLDQRADHFPSELSGGEQQRVAIARGIVKDPAIVLCDEPTGELDFETGRQILVTLHQLTHDGSKLVIVVTHNSAIAECADRVIRLRSGRVISDERNAAPVDPAQMVW